MPIKSGQGLAKCTYYESQHKQTKTADRQPIDNNNETKIKKIKELFKEIINFINS